MQYQPGPGALRSLISRRIQLAFLIGLIVGILIGWALSGVVGAVLKFGLLAVLLVPLVLALILWWKVRQTPDGGTTVITWGSTSFPPPQTDIYDAPPPTYERHTFDPVEIELQNLREERKQ